jgi:CheY-like chemotaxis protein
MFDAYSAYEDTAKNVHLKTGLGLDISKKFAVLMGGDLTYQTEVNKGSAFTLTIVQKIMDSTPIGIFEEKETVAIRAEYKPQFIAPDADVLVASANSLNLDVIDNLLKPTKVFVTRANNKHEFFDKLRMNAFNIAFIDQVLLDETENELEEIIFKIREINPGLPVYIITGNSLYGQSFYTSKGFSGTLALPIDSAILEKIIRHHLPEEIMDAGEDNV